MMRGRGEKRDEDLTFPNSFGEILEKMGLGFRMIQGWWWASGGLWVLVAGGESGEGGGLGAVAAPVAGDMAAENSDFAQVLAEEFGDGGMDFGAFAAQLKQEKEGGNKSSKGK